MTKETIQQKIEQEAEKYFQTSKMCGDDKFTFKAGATFVLETLLPEIERKVLSSFCEWIVKTGVKKSIHGDNWLLPAH